MWLGPPVPTESTRVGHPRVGRAGCVPSALRLCSVLGENVGAALSRGQGPAPRDGAEPPPPPPPPRIAPLQTKQRWGWGRAQGRGQGGAVLPTFAHARARNVSPCYPVVPRVMRLCCLSACAPPPPPHTAPSFPHFHPPPRPPLQAPSSLISALLLIPPSSSPPPSPFPFSFPLSPSCLLSLLPLLSQNAVTGWGWAPGRDIGVSPGPPSCLGYPFPWCWGITS